MRILLSGLGGEIRDIKKAFKKLSCCQHLDERKDGDKHLCIAEGRKTHHPHMPNRPTNVGLKMVLYSGREEVGFLVVSIIHCSATPNQGRPAKEENFSQNGVIAILEQHLPFPLPLKLLKIPKAVFINLKILKR